MQKRDISIDLLRGFGIICMIVGHIYFGMLCDKIIHAFHMPLFFIISGYLFTEDRSIVFIKKKAIRLMVPYLFFSILAFLLFLFISQPTDIMIMNSLKAIIFFPTSDYFPIIGALWFLVVLFVVYLIIWCIMRFENRNIKIILLFCITTLGFILGRLNVLLPFGFGVAFVSVGFFSIGMIIKKYRLVDRLNNYVSILLLVIGIALAILNGNVNMRTMMYANEWCFILSATMLVISFWKICSILNASKIQNCWVLKEIRYIGSKSMAYLCLNQVALYVFDTLLLRDVLRFKYNGLIDKVVIKIILLIIVLLTIHLIRHFIPKALLPIFGEGKVMLNDENAKC